MTSKHFAYTAAAICFAFSSVSFSQATPGTTSRSATPTDRTLEQQCSVLTGAALDTCMKQLAEQKRTPGRSEDATARESGRSPGQGGAGAPVGGTTEPGGAGKAKGGSSY